MSERFGIVWSAVRLIVVLAVPGTAMAAPPSAVSAAGSPPAAGIVLQHPQASLPPPADAARPLAVSGISGHRSPTPASESRPLAPVREGKQLYALVLSSLGMLGVIALHRLTDIV